MSPLPPYPSSGAHWRADARDVDLGTGGWEIVEKDLIVAWEQLQSLASRHRLNSVPPLRYPTVGVIQSRWLTRRKLELYLDFESLGGREVGLIPSAQRRYVLSEAVWRSLGILYHHLLSHREVTTYSAEELTDGDRLGHDLESVVSRWPDR